jgi:hypothetical protein
VTSAVCWDPDPWAVGIICIVVTACVAWLGIDIYVNRRGHRWGATLFGGILFGWIVEYVNTHDIVTTHHIYCYPDSWINLHTGVPFWVPVGWGGIIYAATWTSQQLRLPWWGRPIASAFLAASIDFSLDPVARLLGFWSWQKFDVNFVDVPYDNFVGWYMIVLIYSLSSAWVLGTFRRKRWDFGPTPTADQKRASALFEWLAPILCALVATGIFLLFEHVLSGSDSYSKDDGHIAAILFIAATLLGIGVTVVFGREPAPAGNAGVNWPVIVVPVLIHLTCYGLFLWFSFRLTPKAESLLVAAIPLQLLAGAFVFTAHWRRRLLVQAAAQAKTPLGNFPPL